MNAENPYILQYPELLAGKTLLYVHGFASSGQSGTVSRLRTVMPQARVIAPDLPIHPAEALNWKRDETYAPASENKGSIVLEMDGTTPVRKIVKLDVDAQVNLARGVIVTTTKEPVTNMPDFFGPASFHENDYSFFYKNLQENVAKRIATYKNNAK